MAEALLMAALGVIAIAAVAYPVLVGRERFESPDALDRALERYRHAEAAGTVCARCRFANPEGSRFCAECGTRIQGD